MGGGFFVRHLDGFLVNVMDDEILGVCLGVAAGPIDGKPDELNEGNFV